MVRLLLSLAREVRANLVASSAFDVYLITTGTAEVTAQVEDSRVKTVATYIVGAPTLTVGHPGDPQW